MNEEGKESEAKVTVHNRNYYHFINSNMNDLKGEEEGDVRIELFEMMV